MLIVRNFSKTLIEFAARSLRKNRLQPIMRCRSLNNISPCPPEPLRLALPVPDNPVFVELLPVRMPYAFCA